MKVAALILLTLFVSEHAMAADWSDWERSNAVAQEGDWLVIRQPGEGFCYLKQSYHSDPSKMELTTGKDGVPTLITPFFRGLEGVVIYRIDDGAVESVTPDDGIGGVQFPRGLMQQMQAGEWFEVSVDPVGGEPVSQSFSLSGFKAAHEWLGNSQCKTAGG